MNITNAHFDPNPHLLSGVQVRQTYAHGLRIGARLQASGGVYERAHEALTRGWSLTDNSTEQHWNCDLSLPLFLSSCEHNKCAHRPQPTSVIWSSGATDICAWIENCGVVNECMSKYLYMCISRRLQQYSSLRLALCGAAMCDADMGDVVVGGEAAPAKRHGVLLGQSRWQGKEGEGGEIFHKNA